MRRVDPAHIDADGLAAWRARFPAALAACDVAKQPATIIDREPALISVMSLLVGLRCLRFAIGFPL